MCKICINTFIEECYCDICEKITPHEVFYCCDKIGRKLEQYDWKSKRCICGKVVKPLNIRIDEGIATLTASSD